LFNQLKLGPPIPPLEMARIHRHLHLECNKWDTQVGDQQTLLNQALIINRREWHLLCSTAEQLAAETLQRERELLDNPKSAKQLGLPKALWPILTSPKPQPRAMRFDFHPTSTGWCVSEVNSDVPGGWNEGTNLPLLYQPFYPDLELPASPLDAWLNSIRPLASKGCVAFLVAPGFLEDQQVVLTFIRKLHSLSIPCKIIHTPAAVDFKNTRDPISAIVRFYQIEWLCSLPAAANWKQLLQATQIPVVNPAIAAISESKRFPLTFSDSPAWKDFMPECRDPRDVNASDWDNWALKATYSNTGDRVYLCDTLPRQQRETLIKKANRKPMQWIAQRRFQTLLVQSTSGPLHPCVGVFVVDGQAAGAYVRLSTHQVTDGAAKEAPLLIEQ